MSEPLPPPARAASPPLDARLARRLVSAVKHTWIRPNYLTSVRVAFGIAAAAAVTRGSYGWMNCGALLLVISNFLDHTDGELARITGKSSRLGHWYDLLSDAAVTVLLFSAIGVGVGKHAARVLGVPPLWLGALAGTAVTVIFFLRMRIEALGGKAASQQVVIGGFESEDVLYLFPLVTLCNAVAPFLTAAAIGAPLFALWVVYQYRRAARKYQR